MVMEIKQHDNINFFYLQLKDNAADIASRGTSTSILDKNELWWYGPSWLSMSLGGGVGCVAGAVFSRKYKCRGQNIAIDSWRVSCK